MWYSVNLCKLWWPITPFSSMQANWCRIFSPSKCEHASVGNLSHVYPLYVHEHTWIIFCLPYVAAIESNLQCCSVHCEWLTGPSAVCIEVQIWIDLLLCFLRQTDVNVTETLELLLWILPSRCTREVKNNNVLFCTATVAAFWGRNRCCSVFMQAITLILWPLYRTVAINTVL